MKRAHILISVAVAVMLVFGVFSGVALAATSTDAIILDYQTNGKLTGTYTVAELEAYLNDAAAHQYLGAEEAAALDALVRAQIAALTATTSQERHAFPFTGTELFAGLGAALVLIGAGFGLRRVAVRS